MLVASLGRLSLIAYSVCTLVNLPMAVTTDMIWRASSLDGAKQMALGTRFSEYDRSFGYETHLGLIKLCVDTTEHGEDERCGLPCS